MEIARVVHTFYPESEGDYFGTNRLSWMQAINGDKVRVYTWGQDGRPVTSRPADNLVVVRLRGVNLGIPFLFKEYPIFPSLGSEIARERPDVIHAHSHLFLTTLQAGLAAKRGRIPFVVTVHGVYAKRGFPTDSLQWVYLRTLGRTVFRLAARVVCVSRGDVAEVVALGCPERKIRVVPNAVDSLLYKPGSYPRRENEILWVGRFVPEKGLEDLLLAMKAVLKQQNATLRLVGDGPTWARFQALAKKLGIEANIIFQGRVGMNEVARFMAEASVFALPSLKEGLPKALLQALSSELAVVASAIPGVTDVVNDGTNGLLFRPGDVNGLANAIGALLSDKNLATKLGRNGRTTVVQSYNWKSTLESLNRVYSEAADIA